jgi:hypothetical protein
VLRDLLFDAHDGRLSLTTILLVVTACVCMIAPSEITLGAFCISALLYGHKRALRYDLHPRREELARLKSDVAALEAETRDVKTLRDQVTRIRNKVGA